jgi:hypothetical protein
MALNLQIKLIGFIRLLIMIRLETCLKGGTMKIKAIIMLSSMVLAGMMVTVSTLGGDTKRAALEAIVNDYIAACEAKSAMFESRSKNIRRAAVHAFVRATFCRDSKAVLIDELVANNVAPKEHTVHHYLNARFNKIVSAGKLALK